MWHVAYYDRLSGLAIHSIAKIYTNQMGIDKLVTILADNKCCRRKFVTRRHVDLLKQSIIGRIPVM